MNNLFISYDLISPGQNYDAVTKAIKGLGSWAKVHLSLFYVSTAVDIETALKRVQAAADANDKIIVIHATNATWVNLSQEASDHMKNHWSK